MELTLAKKENIPVPIARPWFDRAEEEAVVDVLRSGWVAQGPRVAEFERLVAEYTGARYALAVSSGTAALHLAMLAAGIGPGDSVLVPSFTFVATANAVEFVGARPVFVDINPRTFNLDPNSLIQTINRHKCETGKNCRGVVPVSLFGLGVDMPAIDQIAKEYDLIVIEDAACALGAFAHDFHAGRKAAIATFSFHPRKVVVTGEGGMIITDDESLADRVKRLRNHGAELPDSNDKPRRYGSLLPDHHEVGYNYRLTDIQGAIGVVQMSKLDEMLASRREAAERYHQLLAGVNGLTLPLVPNGYRHACQAYVCLLMPDCPVGNDGFDWSKITDWNRKRNQIMAALEADNIAVRQGTHAVHTLGYYRQKYSCRFDDCPYSYIADRLSIALPLFPGITSDQQERIASVLNEAIHRTI